ncbi:MAG TPA: hypothetical protein VH642_12305, partial [Streptosporangiaceae bacterium]
MTVAEVLALIAAGAASLALLAPSRQDRAPRRGTGPGQEGRRPWLLAGVLGVAIYIGYFGAAGGIV